MPNDVLHIDIHDEAALTRWSGELAVTREQLREAVQAVGDRAADVEQHLKGSHASTDADEQARAPSTGGE